MATIPVNAANHLLEHASRVPDLALAVRRFPRDDQRIAPAFVAHAMDELVMPFLTRAMGSQTVFSVGADAYFVLETASAAVLSDYQYHTASRMSLGQCATVARFREPNQGIPELLDSLNGLVTTLDFNAYRNGIVAVSVPKLKAPCMDDFDPSEVLDDPDPGFMDQMNKYIGAVIIAFANSRNKPVGTPWSKTLHDAISRMDTGMHFVATGGPALTARWNVAIRLIKEIRKYVRAPRTYNVGKNDIGTACIGFHPSFPLPVLAIVNDDGQVTSIHERDRFPTVTDGEAVSLRY